MTSPPLPGPTDTPSTDSITLSPHYGVAIGVVALGLTCLGLLPLWAGALWLSMAIGLFGLFLLLQTALLRLEFCPDALLVHRRDTLLRRFPYDSWLGWRLFWPAVPLLFYFREERSIHLLPVLFNPATLRSQLTQHLAHLAATTAADDGHSHP